MAGTDPSIRHPSWAAWLTLERLPGLGSRAKISLLENFGSIEAVFSASHGQLKQVLGTKSDATEAILAGPDDTRLVADLAWLEDESHQLLTWLDARYPPLLREIPDPPIVLYVHGNPDLLASPQLAVVGSRNPTPSGRENAHAFAATLARSGLVITSGLALGIDAAAHRGALEAACGTVAVCGTGLDRVYPARHRELAHAIAEHGALVSEFPLGSPPRPEHFPVRNRIISGLSLGTLVVEAAVNSGSLITARLATEQGREVFAIPGSIHSPLSRGCHALIRQGAKLVETAQDVLEELGPLWRVALPGASTTQDRGMKLDPEMIVILECLGYDEVGIDSLVERSGLTAEAVSSMLLQLELCGCVQACPGGKYLRIS